MYITNILTKNNNNLVVVVPHEIVTSGKVFLLIDHNNVDGW